MYKPLQKFVVLGLLVIGLIISPSIIMAHAATYQPAVIGGQWGEYKVKSQTCQSSIPGVCESQSAGNLDNSDYSVLRVASVVGTSLTLELITVYKNGTGTSQGVLADVATGSSNFTALTMGPPANYFVLAGGLQGGEKIWDTSNAPILNGTRTETVAGSARYVNILNFTTTTNNSGLTVSSSYNFAWDQQSGLFVEVAFQFTYSYSINGMTGYSQIGLAVGMVDNNIWASPGSSSLPDFGLNAGPETVTVTQGASGDVTVDSVRIKGF